jgi:glycosyltransferase involved in cell wall biosynthesis
VPFELDLVGQEVGERGQMQRRLVTGNLAPMLRFHGALPRASLRLLFEQADLLIVTSHYEAGPLVVFEAAMVGVPCVGTNVGHLAEWAPDAARVVATGAARALAENVAFLLAHEDERMALATEAQARAMLENADVTTAAFRRVYSEMAHR